MCSRYQRYSGTGFGGDLLVDALRRIALAADTHGIAVALLDVLDCGNPRPSSELAVFAQKGNQIGESLSGGCVGTELEFELGQSAAILALSSASRALSLLICEISFSTREISFSSCCIRCLRAIDLISIATTGCQLSLDNQRRQRGSEDK